MSFRSSSGLICALEAKNIEDAIRNAISIGGDLDTLAVIASGVAESLLDIPENWVKGRGSRIPLEMRQVLEELNETAG